MNLLQFSGTLNINFHLYPSPVVIMFSDVPLGESEVSKAPDVLPPVNPLNTHLYTLFSTFVVKNVIPPISSSSVYILKVVPLTHEFLGIIV